MKLSELILKLQEAQREHGDLPVSGVHVVGGPEMTITNMGYAPAGRLPKAAVDSTDDLPPRFVLDWEDL